MIDTVLAAHEIATVSLDDMVVSTQIALFRGAELIIAPHGASLANLAFARPGTAVLELNRQLDGSPICATASTSLRHARAAIRHD